MLSLNRAEQLENGLSMPGRPGDPPPDVCLPFAGNPPAGHLLNCLERFHYSALFTVSPGLKRAWRASRVEGGAGSPHVAED